MPGGYSLRTEADKKFAMRLVITINEVHLAPTRALYAVALGRGSSRTRCSLLRSLTGMT